MQNAKRLVIPILLLLVTGQSASAQQEIVLDNVTNSIGDSLLIAGNTHIISIRYRNFPPDTCVCNFNPNNGYVLYSSDGATWNRTYGTISTEFMGITSSQMFLNHFEDPTVGGDSGEGPNDGVSPDFVGLASICFACVCGLYDGFDEIALRIEIQSNLSDTGLQICIDSSSLGRLNDWDWFPAGQGECRVAPDWGGPYCFTIVANCCQWSVGNVDFDDAGIVDISDLTVLIDHLFINFPPLQCEAEANIDGDPQGIVDITDLTVLIDHLFINFPQLPSCQ